MKRYCCALLLAAAGALCQESEPAGEPDIQPWQEKALQNALQERPLDPILAGRPAPETRRCTIPLRTVPADPKIDPGFIRRPPESFTSRMPVRRGLPVCRRR